MYRGPRTVTRRCAIADPRLDRQLAEDGGWGETLDGLLDIGRQRETAGAGGSLLRRVSRVSTHRQETL